MKRKYLFVCAVLVLLAALCSCIVFIQISNSFPNKIKSIKTGMSREMVVHILGKPQFEGEAIKGVISMCYAYPKRKQEEGGLVPTICAIDLVNEKVIYVSTGYR